MENFRVMIEKKGDFNVEAKKLKKDAEFLGIEKYDDITVLNVYDIFKIDEANLSKIVEKILFEPNVDNIYYGELNLKEDELAFRFEYNKGQFDPRQNATEILINKYLGYEDSSVKVSKIILVKGMSKENFSKLKSYYINPVNSKEVPLNLISEDKEEIEPKEIEIIDNFVNYSEDELIELKGKYNLALDLEDLLFIKDHCKKTMKKPTITEIKILDTYWSDHCRHKTFMSEITEIKLEDGDYKSLFENVLKEYMKSREYVHNNNKPICLMDLATINMKEIEKNGKLTDREISEEVNAASIEVEVDVNGEKEKWLLMFKNETHNHPTEIEPFGGAATCLGGGIRDPLSGRGYVYQAMRITGAKDPRTKFEDTLQGKLPQRKITTMAVEGYSSYAYQIGGASGYVKEFYDDGFEAKRLELGALVAAAPKDWVRRGVPKPNDLVLLVGGKTGRDGLGAAVGSSVEQKKDTLITAGAQVQKGDPQTERKIVRLFRNEEASKMIKRCNDFGAGGVAVAVGELADGLLIDLDKVPTKYEGMDGTEIALSESQERMAIVIDENDLEKFKKLAEEEDLEVAVIAKVTEEKRMKMLWRNKVIVDLERSFLDTNGIRKKAKVHVVSPLKEKSVFLDKMNSNKTNAERFIDNLKDLNCCSQKGLIERFDNTIGKNAVVVQLGGKEKLTPQVGMAAKFPVMGKHTNTASIMTCGYDPEIAKWSTFHGGYYAVIDSVARVIALGGDYKRIRLSFQEFYESLGEDPKKWAKPFTSLLGAYKVQKELEIPSIGGKDSMSGSFENINVAPSLFSFAVCVENSENIISQEFKATDSLVIEVMLKRDENDLVDLDSLKYNYSLIKKLVDEKKILSSNVISHGGLAKAIFEMCIGNDIGFKFSKEFDDMYMPSYGNIILEISQENEKDISSLNFRVVGTTQKEKCITIGEENLELALLKEVYLGVLEEIFPIKEDLNGEASNIEYKGSTALKSTKTIAKPRVLIPVFTGTNGEYDMISSFEECGGEVNTFVLKTFNTETIKKSIRTLSNLIKETQILGLANGYFLGNEPETAAKLLKVIFDDEYLKESVYELLYKNDGLILGIGSGFNALIKLGLIEHGKFVKENELSPSIIYNYSGDFYSNFVDVKVTSKLSPWFNEMEIGHVYTVPVATKEGRVFLNNSKNLIDKGQISTQFIKDGNATYDGLYNPTGSEYAIESMTSPDGRILGTVSSIDRIADGIYKNIDIKGKHKIFESGVNYYK